jgi:hypothetical protein
MAKPKLQLWFLAICVTFELILSFCSLSNREIGILFWSFAGKGWYILKQEV